ncbi:MAG: diaminopropionate ammonia-lyase [Acidimicrobiia bacterium]
MASLSRPAPPRTGSCSGALYIRPSAAEPSSTASTDRPRELHRRLPGYQPTPLRRAPLAEHRLGLERLWVKDESHRLGLPAFKMLGASWALYRALCERLGREPEPWSDLTSLVRVLAPLRPLTLVCATDGNHGRAVARLARLLEFSSRIYVPENTVPARIEAITNEGASVSVVAGTYDDAVVRAGEEAERPDVLIVSDTAWQGYEEIPRWVIEGYSTIFAEIEEELARRGEPGPDLVVVQMGVGAFAAAVIGWYLAPSRSPTRVLGVEPTRAACVLESLRAGEMVHVEGGQDSIMAGLNCGTPSLVAWPVLRDGLAACVAIDDERAREAVRLLADDGLESGESGAAGLGGLLEIAEQPAAADRVGLHRGSRVLAFSTEGPTDPREWEAIVGRPPFDVDT